MLYVKTLTLERNTITMERIVIRDAKRKDCADIRRLIQELANDLGCPGNPKLSESGDLEEDGFSSMHPYFHCFVAEAVDENCLHMVVGYAVYYYTYSTWQGKAIYLEDIYVLPEYRKHGIGSSLFAKVAQKGYKSGCSRMDFLVMDHSAAGEFYKKKGAVDITSNEGWHHYKLCKEAMASLSHMIKYTERQHTGTGK